MSKYRLDVQEVQERIQCKCTSDVELKLIVACVQAVLGSYTPQRRSPGSAPGVCERHHRRVCCAHGLRLVRVDLCGVGHHCAVCVRADCIQPHPPCEASSS